MPEEWTGRLIGDMHNAGVSRAEVARELGVSTAYLQALAAEQAAAKKSGGGGGGGKTSSSGLTDKKNETLAKAAQSYRQKNPGVYLDSRTLDNYLNSKGYTALEANTFKAYLEYYGATYQRQR